MALRIGTSHLSEHLTLFTVHGFSAGGDIMYLMCQVTPRDHLIKGSCKFMGEKFMSMSSP